MATVTDAIPVSIVDSSNVEVAPAPSVPEKKKKKAKVPKHRGPVYTKDKTKAFVNNIVELFHPDLPESIKKQIAKEKSAQIQQCTVDYYSACIVVRKKDKDCPPLPICNFLLCQQAHIQKLKEQGCTDQKELAIAAGEMWQKCTEDEKKPFNDEYKRLRLVYDQKMKEYKEKKAKETETSDVTKTNDDDVVVVDEKEQAVVEPVVEAPSTVVAEKVKKPRKRKQAVETPVDDVKSSADELQVKIPRTRKPKVAKEPKAASDEPKPKRAKSKPKADDDVVVVASSQ